MRLVWTALLLAGCGDPVAIVPLPIWGNEIESWLVARVVDGRVDVEATDDSTVRFDDAVDGADLELRGYTRPLADLRLAPGTVSAPGPGTFARALPAGHIELVSRVDGTSVGAWREGALPAVARFEFGVKDPCARLTAEVGELTNGRTVGWAVSLDPDNVLFGSVDDFGSPVTITKITAPKTLTSIEVIYDGNYRPEPRGAFLDASGALWFGDVDGGLWRGELAPTSLRFTRIVGPTPHGHSQAIAGNPQNPIANLFTVTSSGTLARLDDGRWSALNNLAIDDPIDPKIAIIWLGTNDVLYGTSAWPKIRRWRALLDVEEFQINDAGAGITGMKQLADDRVVVGMGAGLIAIFDGTEFTRLGLSRLTLDVLAFAPIGKGFLYTGTFGYVGEWNEDVGFCPIDDSPIAGSSIRHMLPVGDKLFLVGDKPRGPNNTSFTLLTVDQP